MIRYNEPVCHFTHRGHFMEQACTYQLLDNNIHEFHFKRAKTEAIDQWLDQTTAILEQLPEDGQYRAILNLLDSAMLPVNYMMTRVRAWQKEHPNYKSGRIAIIYKSGVILGLSETITNLLTRRLDLS